MRVCDNAGVELNAEFHVEPDQGLLSVVLESAGGKTASGDRARNDEYVPALRTLLARLLDRRAVLMSALVASTRVEALPEEQRMLVRGPTPLDEVTDIEKLRLAITSAQGRIGLPAGARKLGNNRKRIRLRLEVPGYGIGDAQSLVSDLAKPGGGLNRLGGDPPGALPMAGDLVRDLVGETILTLTGRPNTILAVRGDVVVVQTDRSPEGQSVDIAQVQHGLDLLAADGVVQVSVAELGHRSSFVGAVLAMLPGVKVGRRPATVSRAGPPDEPLEARHDGVLESSARVKVRGEQSKLRRLLAGGAESADCALCGEEYPLRFLVAAHIKLRAACTDEERRNLRHVAMLACTFGCDALYEAGWITVDADGTVQAKPGLSLPEGALRRRLQHLQDRPCPAHTAQSARFFAWHRSLSWDPTPITGGVPAWPEQPGLSGGCEMLGVAEVQELQIPAAADEGPDCR